MSLMNRLIARLPSRLPAHLPPTHSPGHRPKAANYLRRLFEPHIFLAPF